MTQPQVTAALIAGVVALLVALITSVLGFFAQRSKIRQEMRTEFMAELAIVGLLSHRTWKKRSFAAIKARIGGWDDDDLRQLLVRAGALRFVGDEDTELWGLRDRNRDELER